MNYTEKIIKEFEEKFVIDPPAMESKYGVVLMPYMLNENATIGSIENFIRQKLEELAKRYEECVEETENKCVYDDVIKMSPEYGEVEAFREEVLKRMKSI